MLWRVRGECSCGFNAGCDETGVWRESGNHGLEPQSSLRHSLGVCAEHQSIGTRRSNRVCDHRELHVVCRWKRQIFIACLLTHAHEPKHACAHGLVCTLTPGTSASSKLRLIPSASQRMTLTMPKSMPSNSSTPQKWEARKRKISLFHARAHTHALYPLTLRILIQPEYDGFVVIVQCVCVYYCSTSYKAVRVCGGGKQWRTCATRDYEPRPVWTSLPITH